MDQETELKLLNERILEQYGSSLSGKPRFRVVFSDGETEKRRGNFDVFDANGNWLKCEYDVVKTVLKYSSNRSRFVLERYVLEPFGKWPANPPPRFVYDYNGYEPFYIFEWVEEKPVPPLSAIQFIVQANMFGKVPGLAELEEARKKQEAASFQKSMDILDEMSPYLPGMLHDGEAVVVPDMKETKDE